MDSNGGKQGSEVGSWWASLGVEVHFDLQHNKNKPWRSTVVILQCNQSV